MPKQNNPVEPDSTDMTENNLDKLFDYLFALGGGSIKVGIKPPTTKEPAQSTSFEEENVQVTADSTSQDENLSPNVLREIEEDDTPENISPNMLREIEEDDTPENISPNVLREIEEDDTPDYIQLSPIPFERENVLENPKRSDGIPDKVEQLKKSETRSKRQLFSPSSDDDDEFFNTASPPKSCKKVSSTKHTRKPYTNQEREQILRYIVEHEEFAHVKGRDMWLIMASRQACPGRTWQSMKEHFMKRIIYELDKYRFLSKEQKRRLRVNALNI